VNKAQTYSQLNFGLSIQNKKMTPDFDLKSKASESVS